MVLETSSISEAMGTISSFRVVLSQLDPARIRVRDGLKVAANRITVGDLPLFAIRIVTVKDQKVIDVVLETIQAGATSVRCRRRQNWIFREE
jgi:hypothetical protein